MLFAIKEHIAQQPNISLKALAQHFDVPESAMLGMVTLWVRKGHVVVNLTNNHCGSGCGGCQQACDEQHFSLAQSQPSTTHPK